MDAIKSCPFCGNVYLDKQPMWQSHGGVTRGYFGSYKYSIECKSCGCNIRGGSCDTIYHTDEEAIQYVIDNWNTRNRASNKEDGCIDELGGIHYHGIGVNPNGVYCGECGRLTCKGCMHAAVKELQEDNIMKEEAAKKLLFAMTPITEILRVYNLGNGDWEFVGNAGGDTLMYRVYNDGTVTER